MALSKVTLEMMRENYPREYVETMVYFIDKKKHPEIASLDLSIVKLGFTQGYNTNENTRRFCDTLKSLDATMHTLVAASKKTDYQLPEEVMNMAVEYKKRVSKFKKELEELYNGDTLRSKYAKINMNLMFKEFSQFKMFVLDKDD